MKTIIEWGLKVLRGELKPWIWRLALVLVLVSTGPKIFSVVRYGNGLVDKVHTAAVSFVNISLPDNFELDVKNGIVTTNQTEPFYVLVSRDELSSLSSFIGAASSVKRQTVTQIRLLTIDTNAKIEDYTRYQTYYLITRDSMVYTKNGNITVYQLSNIKNLVVTKKLILSKINLYTTGKYKTWAITAIWVSPVLLILLLTGLQVLTWAWQALWVWFIAKIIRANVGYFRVVSLTVYITGVIDLLCVALSYIKPIVIYVNLFAAVWATVVIVGGYYFLNLYKAQYESKT